MRFFLFGTTLEIKSDQTGIASTLALNEEVVMGG